MQQPQFQTPSALSSLFPQPLHSNLVTIFQCRFVCCPKCTFSHYLRSCTQKIISSKHKRAIAFGVRDDRSPHLLFAPGEQRAIVHYIATETGGQYFDASPETYSSALAEILQQLHFRYELGFKPEMLDGKRHKLRVQLADTVKNQHKGVRLRYRLAYVPIPPRVR